MLATVQAMSFVESGKHAMSTERAERILDAAERRIRTAGYNGFSFRDLADDVGIKSASVHYHFPTKEVLVQALVKRYTDRFLEVLDAAGSPDETIEAYREGFRQSVNDDLKMCLCGVLGAEGLGLPPAVLSGTRNFFEETVRRLASALKDRVDDPEAAALSTVAQLQGAVILARAWGDPAIFDQAAGRLAAIGETGLSRR